MSIPSLCRDVKLVDARAFGRPLVTAQLYRDYPPEMLDTIEAHWADAREHAAMAAQTAGLAQPEHEHWDWRNKVDGVEGGRHMLVAIELLGEPQGIMAVLRNPRPGRFGDE